MRSVFAFPAVSGEETVIALDAHSPRNSRAELERLVEDVVWVRVVRAGVDLWLDWTAEAMASVKCAVGVLPDRALQPDVSGRVDGHREVLAVLSVALAAGGRALDDYSDQAWKLEELLVDGRAEAGRVFLQPRTGDHHD